MIAKGPTMCILPWMHIYTSAGGDIVPCCEAQEFVMNEGNLRQTWNGKKYKELRTALIKVSNILHVMYAGIMKQMA